MEKRLAIVTGGSRGIGREIVFSLARAGRAVAALATNAERLSQLKADGEQEGLTIETEVVDVTDSAGLNETIIRLAEAHGGVGVLVNNAGITRDGLSMMMSDEDFDVVIATNLKSAFVATRAATRSMIRNRFGRIVNISSVAGVIGNAGQANYAASKAGLIGMTKSVARELAKRNVTVNCVAPGFIETDMTGGLSDKIKDVVKGNIPMARFGSAADIAGAVAYLTSDEAGYVTGAVLQVDGGMAM